MVEMAQKLLRHVNQLGKVHQQAGVVEVASLVQVKYLTNLEFFSLLVEILEIQHVPQKEVMVH
jgi:hypothetical protein